MTGHRIKRILAAAAELPPEQARRVVAGLVAKAGEDLPTAEELLDLAAQAMQAAMETAMDEMIETAARELP